MSLLGTLHGQCTVLLRREAPKQIFQIFFVNSKDNFVKNVDNPNMLIVNNWIIMNMYVVYKYVLMITKLFLQNCLWNLQKKISRRSNTVHWPCSVPNKLMYHGKFPMEHARVRTRLLGTPE